MFWVQFARSDLRTGARTEARSRFSGKPIRCNEKPRAREVRKSRWTQTARTPPYYYNPGKLLFRRCIPGNPVLWHAAQKCTTDAGLWSGEKHLQEQKQHRFSGLECFSTQESKIFWALFFIYQKQMARPAYQHTMYRNEKNTHIGVLQKHPRRPASRRGASNLFLFLEIQSMFFFFFCEPEEWAGRTPEIAGRMNGRTLPRYTAMVENLENR